MMYECVVCVCAMYYYNHPQYKLDILWAPDICSPIPLKPFRGGER